MDYTQELIQDYYLIGNLHTAALISKNGSIDWLCFPDFDSESVFARILDQHAGTFEIISDVPPVDYGYEKNSAIFFTEYRSDTGGFRVRDFMLPVPKKICSDQLLVRQVEGLDGRTDVQFRFQPRPNYGRAKPIVTQIDNSLRCSSSDQTFLLHLPEGCSLQKSDEGWIIRLEIEAGATESFCFEYVTSSPCFDPAREYADETTAFWNNWVNSGEFFDFCREQSIRSAITLKLMQYYPTGAIIAAPTTSLPEDIGGIRNWDYRFVWIRDATFTLYALYVLGYEDEAVKFFHFIEDIVRHCPDCEKKLNVLYDIRGEQPPEEKELNHLSGYRNSKPVRLGNGAAHQFQLDIYGALIDAYYFMSKRNIELSREAKEIIIELVTVIERRWLDKDNGIWEVRDELQHYTFSKVMAWVGVDRALRLSGQLDIDSETKARWGTLSDDITDWIWKHCYNPDKQTFRQHPDTESQDATACIFPLLQFLDKNDPLTETIIKNTCDELSANEVFMYRYIHDDGLGGEEGAFLLCSYWMISSIALLENVEEATSLFKTLETHLHESGLMAEEVDIESGNFLGNYPQAFSHLGYIMSAYYIDKYTRRQQAQD